MKLADVMQEIADRLDKFAGLRAFGYPPKSVQPPAAIVAYPDSIDFDQSYARGLDQMTLSLHVLAGDVVAQGTRDTISGYVDGASGKSIKARLESGEYTSFDTIDVTAVAFSTYDSNGIEYLDAVFDLEITGSGK